MTENNVWPCWSCSIPIDYKGYCSICEEKKNHNKKRAEETYGIRYRA